MAMEKVMIQIVWDDYHFHRRHRYRRSYALVLTLVLPLRLALALVRLAHAGDDASGNAVAT